MLPKNLIHLLQCEYALRLSYHVNFKYLRTRNNVTILGVCYMRENSSLYFWLTQVFQKPSQLRKHFLYYMKKMYLIHKRT